MSKKEFDPELHALRLIAHANMADNKTLKEAADRIEDEGNNEYYDDGDFLKQIATYLRSKIQ